METLGAPRLARLELVESYQKRCGENVTFFGPSRGMTSRASSLQTLGEDPPRCFFQGLTS